MGRPAAWPSSNHDVVQAFAESHPDVYGGVWVVGSQLHVGLTVMQPHEAALRRLLPDPASVTFRPVRFTTAEIAAVRDEIEQRLRDSGTTWHSFGADIQAATVDLGPDGSALALEFHSRYRDRVRVTVGGRAYPPDGITVPAASAPVATREIPGLQLRAVLDAPEVATGRPFDGTVHLLNTGRIRIRFETDQPLGAVVVDPGGLIAGTYSGWSSGTGQLVDLAPGAAEEIRFFGGTAGGSAEQYSTPPGDYTVTVVVPIRSRPQGELLTPPVPLRVTAATPRTPS